LTGKRLLNLDSEEENCLVLASAGGVRHELFVDASVPFDLRWSAYELCLRGGRGGHSGLDIDKNRLNTNYGWCQMVLSLPQTVGVVSVHGGTADNALAAECSGIFVTQNPCDVSALRADWTQRLQQYTDDG
jgi:dipeptidase D